ncbi:MAG TPA: TRAP transporter small permease [Clostridia bacterium]|nr:TRAP transporter small permease [Clostridia bacterium]
MKRTLKKAVLWLRDCVEIYIPVLAFLGLFCVFVMQIFFRYILRSPKPWSMEVTSMCYVWVVLLGACYAQRKKSHVTFTLIYDMLSVKLKSFTAFLGNMIIFIALAVSVSPTWDYIQFMKVQKSSVLKVGLNYIFAPYMVFLGMMLLYTAIDLYEDFMVFSGLGGKQAEERLLRENKPIYEEVIEQANKEGLE